MKQKTIGLREILIVTLSLISLGGCQAIWDEFSCGYGGPGCGEPRLLGDCESYVSGVPYAFIPQYLDDTGGKKTTATSAMARNTNTEVSLEEDGSITVTALEDGTAEFEVLVDGWSDVYTFSWETSTPAEDSENDCDDYLRADPLDE